MHVYTLILPKGSTSFLSLYTFCIFFLIILKSCWSHSLQYCGNMVNRIFCVFSIFCCGGRIDCKDRTQLLPRGLPAHQLLKCCFIYFRFTRSLCSTALCKLKMYLCCLVKALQFCYHKYPQYVYWERFTVIGCEMETASSFNW